MRAAKRAAMRKSWRNRFHPIRPLFTAMPLVAAVYDAYSAAGHGSGLEMLNAFVERLATVLPLALIMGALVYGLVSVVGALLSRLHGASIAAQAARHEIERRSSPKRPSTANAHC